MNETSAALPRRDAEARVEKALALAGLALAPERSGFQDTRLGRLLLHEAFLEVARALTKDGTLSSPSEARSALEALPDLPPPIRHRLGGSRALEGETLPTTEALLELEATVAALLRFFQGERSRFPGRRGWLLAAGLLLTAILVVWVPRLGSPPNWVKYGWQASSAVSGWKQSGKLGEKKDGLVFHTNQQSAPSVLIDMKRSRTVRQIVLTNRQDCCFERGLPLVVEVGENTSSFSAVGRQERVFNRWVIDFAERKARYVRLRSEATTYLHLSEVEIL